jgi:AmmeMemoRadiSam system protein A
MNPYVSLAKKAVENYIKEGRIISPPKDLPREFLEKKSAIFITIEKEGKLRGCIGTYLPTKSNMAEEIISNAITAATEDYRFTPIQKEDLPYLSYTISVLSRPEQIKDLKELDPQKYGVIVKTFSIEEPHKTLKTGLLLPDLKVIDKTEKQIMIACQKAGINSKKEKIIIYRFTVEKHQ